MYTAYTIPTLYRQLLEERIPYSFKHKFGDHITAKYPYDKTVDGPVEENTTAIIIPYAVLSDGENIECILVKVNGSTTRPDGSRYHITWSIDDKKKTKPVESNTIIKRYFNDLDQSIKLVPLSKVQMKELRTTLTLVVKRG